MEIQPLAVPGAWLVTPRVFDDSRGSFLEWFRADILEAAIGRAVSFVQANHSVSRRGAVRGIHLADLPPGQAKYVYCASGAVLDVVVDLRVGSPTFGAVDAVVLDDVERRAVFVSEGLGHGFCALREDSTLTYLVSTPYDPAVERTVCPLDPDLGLPWPSDVELTMSPKDAAGPSLAEAVAGRILPSYDTCLARYGTATVG